jgi:hypothetical protein
MDLTISKGICSFTEAEQHGIILTILLTIAQEFYRVHEFRDIAENKSISLQSLCGATPLPLQKCTFHEHICLVYIVGFDNQSVLNVSSADANHILRAF